MHQLISEQEDQDDHSRKKAIITLIKRRKTAARFRKIRGALNRLRGSGLNALEIPIKDDQQKTIAWKTITEKDQVHNEILQRNKHHLNQAKPTPFGSGTLNRKLTDPNTRDNEIENLLKNTRSWTHPTEEVENWISHIKQKYDETELKEEANKVSQPITTSKFINYFKQKTKKKRSHCHLEDISDTTKPS